MPAVRSSARLAVASPPLASILSLRYLDDDLVVCSIKVVMTFPAPDKDIQLVGRILPPRVGTLPSELIRRSIHPCHRIAPGTLRGEPHSMMALCKRQAIDLDKIRRSALKCRLSEGEEQAHVGDRAFV
jgi:hypothetical protein